MQRFCFGILFSAVCLSGCASSDSPNIVMVGSEIYLIQPPSNPGSMSTTGIRAALVKQADVFCQGQGRKMQQIVSMARENAIGTYAALEVQFKCLALR